MNLNKKKLSINLEENSEKQHFDIKADIYDQQYGYDDPFTKYKINKKSRDILKYIKSNTKDRKLKILEIGCGTGEYTKIISEKLPNSKIVAIDISPKSIEIARRKCKKCKNVSFAVKSAYVLGYADNSFDVVFGYYILHHLDVKKVASEIYRVLNKGGLGFFYEPNILNPYVYLVKSNRFLKEKVGDSPDEWAINPLKLNNLFRKFMVEYKLTEFVIPINSIPEKYNIFFDKITNFLSGIPLIKYLGGSVQIRLIKK